MIISFRMPQGGSIIPKKGDTIAIGDELISIQSTEYNTYPVAKILSIKPEVIFTYLTIVVGQEIEAGTILAEKKSLVGKKSIVSDVAGVIDHIQYETGDIVVRFGSSGKDTVTRAYFKGVLEDIDGKKGTYSVSFKGGREFKLKNVAGDAGGELLFMNEKDFFTITAENIDGKLIFLDNPQIHILSKLEALGAVGCISSLEFPSTNVPHATFENKRDTEELMRLKKAYFVFSQLENKGVAYT